MSSIIFNDTLIHDLEEIIKYQNILLLKLICRNKNWKFKNLYNNINVNKDVINKSKFICKIKNICILKISNYIALVFKNWWKTI